MSSPKTYSERNDVLRELGFDSYAEYLKSSLWRSIRLRVYGMKGDNCFLCNNLASQLHHRRYHKNDLIGKTIRYIHPVCEECHKKIEFDGERKRSFAAAKQTLRILAGWPVLPRKEKRKKKVESPRQRLKRHKRMYFAKRRYETSLAIMSRSAESATSCNAS
jgi:hypothetical protein